MTNRWGDAEKEALAHAWDWFSMHGGQRMQLVSFFFVGTAFLTSAYTLSVREHLWLVATAIGIFGALFSVLFLLIEWRTKFLAKLGEEAVEALEDRLAESTGFDQLRIIKELKKKPGKKTQEVWEIWLRHSRASCSDVAVIHSRDRLCG